MSRSARHGSPRRGDLQRPSSRSGRSSATSSRRSRRARRRRAPARRRRSGSRRPSPWRSSPPPGRGRDPRSTGRISPRPSAPPWPMPRKTIHSSAASGTSSMPSRPISAVPTITASRCVCVGRRAASTGIANAGAIWSSCVTPRRKPAEPSLKPSALEHLRQPRDGREERHRLQAHEERDRPRHPAAPQRLADRATGTGSWARDRQRQPHGGGDQRGQRPDASAGSQPPKASSNGIAVKVAIVAPATSEVE